MTAEQNLSFCTCTVQIRQLAPAYINLKSTDRNISWLSYPCPLSWTLVFWCSSAKLLLVFSTPFTEVQFTFRIVYAAPKMKRYSENPNSSFKKLCEKWWDTKKDAGSRPLLQQQEEEVAGSRLVQTADIPWNVFAQCCGDARSDTLPRTTWKLLSH